MKGTINDVTAAEERDLPGENRERSPGASRPRPIRRASRLLIAAWFTVSVGACFDDPTDRFLSQEGMGVTTLDDSRTVLVVEPGRQPGVEDPAEISFQASAPTPVLLFGQAGSDAFVTRAIISNVFEEAEIQPTLARLTATEGCPDEEAGRAIVLAPLETEVVGPNTLAVDVSVPSCALLVLRAVLPDRRGELNGAPLRFAVVGETKGNLQIFENIIGRIVELRLSGEWSADFIVALGDLANSPAGIDLLRWQQVAEGAGLPLVVALGRQEVTDEQPLPFHVVFGRSDYSFAIGDVRFSVMDSASGGFSEAQLAFWRRELKAATEPIRLAFMQRPPFDPAGLRDSGFTSRVQGAQIISLLGENGVGTLFTGGPGTFERFEMGGIPIFATGGGGGPLEALSDVGHHFLRVTTQGDGSITVDVEEL